MFSLTSYSTFPNIAALCSVSPAVSKSAKKKGPGCFLGKAAGSMVLVPSVEASS